MTRNREELKLDVAISSVCSFFSYVQDFVLIQTFSGYINISLMVIEIGRNLSLTWP